MCWTVSRRHSPVCAAFGLDPLTSLSEGTLIITCRPRIVEELRASLAKKGIPSFEIGSIGTRSERPCLLVSSSRLRPEAFEPPSADPYWKAYSDVVLNGLR